jgi:hypothetical protein
LAHHAIEIRLAQANATAFAVTRIGVLIAVGPIKPMLVHSNAELRRLTRDH